MTTIQEVAEKAGLTLDILRELPESISEEYGEFSSWTVDTNCGSECSDIIEVGKRLLASTDVAAHPKIWEAIIVAMSIVCLG